MPYRYDPKNLSDKINEIYFSLFQKILSHSALVFVGSIAFSLICSVGLSGYAYERDDQLTTRIGALNISVSKEYGPKDEPEADMSEEQLHYELGCEAICMSIGMWPLAAHFDAHMSGWSTCTCISERPATDSRVVMFRGAHFDRSEQLWPIVRATE